MRFTALHHHINNIIIERLIEIIEQWEENKNGTDGFNPIFGSVRFAIRAGS